MYMYHTTWEFTQSKNPQIVDIHCVVTSPCLVSLPRYGSISQYLESAGFSTEEQERLKEVFLEPAPPDGAGASAEAVESEEES